MSLKDNPKWTEFVGQIHYLPTYLKSLSSLLQRNVKKEELVPLTESDVFLKKYLNQPREIIYQKILNFTDKTSLINIVHEHISEWEVPYMIYLCEVEYCGLLEIPSLSCFNWNFQFNDEQDGLIGFIRKDACEKILLDFYEEYSQLFIEIKIERVNNNAT